jgi:superfamily II DNA/RNA helicase
VHLLVETEFSLASVSYLVFDEADRYAACAAAAGPH